MTDKKVSKEEVKLFKLQLKAAKEARNTALIMDLMRSPMIQMVGSVAMVEILEYAGLLSSKWAGAMEGGVIAMVGLQALKDYGIIGASTLGLGISAGSIFGEYFGLEGDNSAGAGAKQGMIQGLLGFDPRLLTGGVSR